MRKADYAALADVIAGERHTIQNAWFDDEAERLRALETVRRLADQFARRASVDRVAFLKACGIST